MKFPKKALSAVFLFFLLLSGCSKVVTPKIQGSSVATDLSPKEIVEWTSVPNIPEKHLRAPHTSINNQYLELPTEGDTNNYGIKVTVELEKAYSTYLGGDGEGTIAMLEASEKETDDPGLLWQLSFLKAKVLLMMGQAATAEEELIKTAQLERAFLGHSLVSLSLRGEVKIWLEDYEGATQDFAQVIKSIGAWELPIFFLSFPTNRVELYALSTAKLRAYTGMTAIHIFKEDYHSARIWGSESERLFNNVHFVSNHPVYGAGDTTHIDSYYGRAMNLAFLASATLATEKNFQQAEALFNRAEQFFDAIGYVTGKVTIGALKARIYNRLGMHDHSYASAQVALKLAISNGLYDSVWRIGILSGKTLYEKGEFIKAEKAFRQAQDSLDVISGSLRADKAKLRFGVGKEDILYYLVQLDLRNKDWGRLFDDLERGRARAFVDLLASGPDLRNREPLLMVEIKNLEHKILKQRLINKAPGQSDDQGIKKERDLITGHQNLIETLREKDSELADLISVSTISLEQVQKQLEVGEIMAYALPSRDEEKLQFLMIEHEKVYLKKLEKETGHVDRFLKGFRESLFEEEEEGDEEESRGFKISRIKEEVSDVDYQTSIASLNDIFKLDSWEVSKTLYIVPTGTLYFIPWGILETDFPISVLPLGKWLNRPHAIFYSEKKVAIIGDPEFGGALPQLEGARQEAIEIGALYNTEPLLGDMATEVNLADVTNGGVQVLHLATHGIYDGKNPLQSAFILSKNRSAHFITAKQLFETPIPAKLVILSACETGLGQVIAGDDLLGLSRSFYLGGASSILSSLWEIDDQGTLVFMKSFHQNLDEGKNYGEAWVSARNHTKSEGFPPSVYGAFILGGMIK